MANLGAYKRTIHVSRPNDVDVPDPEKAPAFEVEVPLKERIKEKLKTFS